MRLLLCCSAATYWSHYSWHRFYEIVVSQIWLATENGEPYFLSNQFFIFHRSQFLSFSDSLHVSMLSHRLRFNILQWTPCVYFGQCKQWQGPKWLNCCNQKETTSKMPVFFSRHWLSVLWHLPQNQPPAFTGSCATGAQLWTSAVTADVWFIRFLTSRY